jgi:hypothetical protein
MTSGVKSLHQFVMQCRKQTIALLAHRPPVGASLWNVIFKKEVELFAELVEHMNSMEDRMCYRLTQMGYRMIHTRW